MLEKLKILVVDDDAIIGEMLKDILVYRGYEVIVSQKPLETEQNIIENNIELVLLDKLISGVDGTEICGLIRNNKDTKHIKILMMSALHNAKPVCLEAGANAFITKPFEMESLFNKVEDVLAE
ncbi:MAG TPA: response regulator [Gillisia sp.]|nr:response regulator [Gillisia sp.]